MTILSTVLDPFGENEPRNPYTAEELGVSTTPADTETLVSLTLRDIAKVMQRIPDEAEVYYYLWRVVADLGKAKEDLSNDFKENGLESVGVAGGKAYLDISEHTTTRLDTKALEKALGKQALEPYRTSRIVKTVKVKYLGDEASE